MSHTSQMNLKALWLLNSFSVGKVRSHVSQVRDLTLFRSWDGGPSSPWEFLGNSVWGLAIKGSDVWVLSTRMFKLSILSLRSSISHFSLVTVVFKFSTSLLTLSSACLKEQKVPNLQRPYCFQNLHSLGWRFLHNDISQLSLSQIKSVCWYLQVSP